TRSDRDWSSDVCSSDLSSRKERGRRREFPLPSPPILLTLFPPIRGAVPRGPGPSCGVSHPPEEFVPDLPDRTSPHGDHHVAGPCLPGEERGNFFEFLDQGDVLVAPPADRLGQELARDAGEGRLPGGTAVRYYQPVGGTEGACEF